MRTKEKLLRLIAEQARDIEILQSQVKQLTEAHDELSDFISLTDQVEQELGFLYHSFGGTRSAYHLRSPRRLLKQVTPSKSEWVYKNKEG